MNLSKWTYDFPSLLYIVRNSPTPKYPEFTTFASRLRTFDSFTPKYQTKFSLCEAGFKFQGVEDCVQCFNCGLILHKWSITDDPWAEHGFHSPRCTFVLLKKGSQFIDSSIQRKPKVACDCGCSPTGYDVIG